MRENDQPLNLEANKCLFTMLLNQATFLERYFDCDSVAAANGPLSIPNATAKMLAVSSPLLDYLYDKHLQLDMDMRSLLYDLQLDLDCPVETFVDRIETAMNDSQWIGVAADSKLRNFRTLYRFRYDNLLQDHSNHYQLAFIPFYRFSRHKNFSQAVGNTMKKNVRLLYDHVRGLLKNDDACPCIVLYNLFVRDSFRLFSLVSTQHFNYVRVLDDRTGIETIITYVELTNAFPQVSQWFPSVNNQYVKKYGPYTWQKLRYNLQLMLNSSSLVSLGGSGGGGDRLCRRQSAAVAVSGRQQQRQQQQQQQQQRQQQPLRARRNNGRVVATKPVRSSVASRKGGKNGCRHGSSNVSAVKRLRLDHLFLSYGSAVRTTQQPAETDTVAAAAAAIDHGHLSLDRLFRSDYLDCKHPNVVRVYVQLRSGDESATLIVSCTACGKRLV